MQQDLTPETYWDRILHQPIQEDCPMRRTLELLSGKWRLSRIFRTERSLQFLLAEERLPCRTLP